MTRNIPKSLKWIIDCDPGCDDAIALAMAAKALKGKRVEILTVAGNIDVELTTWNARRVLSACGVKWKVYRGCASSLSGEAIPATSVHGRDGLGDIPNNAFDIQPEGEQKDSAVRRYRLLAESGQAFVLVCTGPLTNLASALNLMNRKVQCAFWNNCELCVVMGGVFEAFGNITASAEFNTHFDPVACHLVLDSWRRHAEASAIGPLPIHFVPLDITEKVAIPLHHVDKGPKNPENKVASFLLAALRKYGIFHARNCVRPRDTQLGLQPLNKSEYLKARVAGESGLKELGAFCYLHDPLAMWVTLKRKDNDFENWWSEATIRMDITPGPGRGQLILEQDKREQGVVSQVGTTGTKVRWLSPERFVDDRRRAFVADVARLLDLPCT